MTREHKWNLAPNARALERSKARAAFGFGGRIWVAGHGGWSGSRAAEPPPCLAARLWSRVLGGAAGLSCSPAPSEVPRVGRLGGFYSRRLINANSESDFLNAGFKLNPLPAHSCL